MVRTVIAALCIGISAAVLGTISLVTLPFAPGGAIFQWAAKSWAAISLWVCGVKVEIFGRERISYNGTYLFASNHASTVDILAFLYSSPTRCHRMIAKKGLFRIPIFGWTLAAVGFIPLERRNRESARQCSKKALERMRTGTSVVVYPEGTRSRDGVLLPFKTGSFLMAIRAGIPVVPVTVTGSHRVQPKGRFFVRPGTVKLIFDDPISTEGLTEAERLPLAHRAQVVVARHLAEAGQISPEKLRQIQAAAERSGAFTVAPGPDDSSPVESLAPVAHAGASSRG